MTALQTVADLKVRLRTAETHLEVALTRREQLDPGTPEWTEWNGIVYACLSEQRHARSDLDRLRARLRTLQ